MPILTVSRPSASLPPAATRRQMRSANAHASVLIHSEAVHQAIAAGAPQVGLGASAILSARRVRRVPRFGRLVVTQSLAVSVPQHYRALCAARVVPAGTVVASGEGGAVGLRTREDVVAIRRVAASVGYITFFAECRLLGQIV